ncbi:hypothetical protein ACHAXS_002527 [Conticribra weissflogii]
MARTEHATLSLPNSGVAADDGECSEPIPGGQKNSDSKNSSLAIPPQVRRDPTTARRSIGTHHDHCHSAAEEKDNDIDLYDENDSANFSEEIENLDSLSTSLHRRKERLHQRRCQGYERESEDEDEVENDSLLQISNHLSASQKQSRPPTPIREHEQDNEREYHFNDSGTKIHITAEEGWFSDDKAVMQAREFDERVLSKITTVEESHRLLRRMRAVASLASRLMAAPDETSCYDIVSRLLVPLFEVDRCSYVLLKDSENVIVKQITANTRDHVSKMGMDGGIDGVVKPLNGTAAGVCARTLEQHYTPRTKDSPFETQRIVYTMGLNSVLATPILVNGNKFVGCIVICMVKEDAFREVDRILINDIAAMLGANIYCKRMRQSSDRSNKVAREMLHSMIPAKVSSSYELFLAFWKPLEDRKRCSMDCKSSSTHHRQVIEKIECFWDVKSEEYWRRRSSVGSMTSQTCFESNTSSLHSSYIDRADEMNSKIHFLNEMNRIDHDYDEGIIIDRRCELTTTSRALYAEEVNNVCIIFLDIVGFSRMSLELKPIQIMDMLHDLFGRYDNLCDKHGVLKLETVGDAYVCATNLLKESDDYSPGDEYLHAQDAALNALEMAKDMIRQAQHVIIPRSIPMESVQVRVGIHIGEVTCGVLGERLPKFAVFGSAVNLAARMEQTSLPGRIRVSHDFYEMVKDSELEWDERKKCISVKNMGEIDTYLLNPIKRENELTGLLTSLLADRKDDEKRNF